MAGISNSAPLHALLLAFSSCSPLHSTKLFAHYDYLRFINLLHFLARIIYSRADFRLVCCFSAFVRSFLFSFLMISCGPSLFALFSYILCSCLFILVILWLDKCLNASPLPNLSRSSLCSFFITFLQLLPFLVCVYISYWL